MGSHKKLLGCKVYRKRVQLTRDQRLRAKSILRSGTNSMLNVVSKEPKPREFERQSYAFLRVAKVIVGERERKRNTPTVEIDNSFNTKGRSIKGRSL
jgi:hypothetical protein